MILRSKKIFTTCAAVYLAVGSAFVSLQYLSVITATDRFLCVSLDRGPEITIATNCRGLSELNNRRCRVCLYCLPLLARLIHYATVAEMSFAV